MMHTATTIALSILLHVVQARPRGKRKAALEVKGGLVVLAIVTAVVLAVPVLLTIYRMYYDPLTPHLWRVIKKSIRDYFSTPVEARQASYKKMTSREIATEMYQKSLAQRGKAAAGAVRQRPARPLNPPSRPPAVPLDQ